MTLFDFLRSRRNAEVVHVHGRLPLFLCAMSLLASRGRLRFVATVHQFDVLGARGWLSWKSILEAILLRRMDRICCVSEDLKEEVLSRIGRDKEQSVDVIHNWIEPLWYGRSRSQPMSPRGQNDKERVRICGIGRLSTEKGFHVLVKAIEILKRRGFRVDCDIFGDGPERSRLRKLADALGVSANVHLRATSTDVRLALPEYDVVAIPSLSESFGIVALEAYDACVPVVASDIPGLRATVVHGKTGLLFAPGSGRSLSEAVAQLVHSDSLRCELIANGIRQLERHLADEALKQSYRQFYARTLRDKRYSDSGAL